MAWIITAIVVCILLILNETDFWLPVPHDYRKLKRISTCAKISLQRPRRKKAESAVLFLHEFSGTPRSLEEFGKYLYDHNYDVFIPALPGAVNNEEELDQIQAPNYKLWWGYIRDRYTELKKDYSKIVVIGASLGGAMGLRLAEYYSGTDMEPKALVAISSPAKVKGRHFRKRFKRNLMLSLSGILSLFVRKLHTGKRPPEAQELCPVFGIDGVVVPASIHSHRIGLRKLRRGIRRVKAPLLAFHARGDRTVDFRNLDWICGHVGSAAVDKQAVSLEGDESTRRHRIANHIWVKEEIYRKTLEFLERVL